MSIVHVALVDSLVNKTRVWEQDRDIQFTYDGVPLLAMLDEYAMLRQDREEEKRRLRVCISFDWIMATHFRILIFELGF